MTARTVLIVARRELVERVRTTAYRLSTLAVVVVAAGAITLSHLLGGAPRHYNLGVTSGVPARVSQAIVSEGSRTGVSVSVRKLPATSVNAAVRAGSVQAVLESGNRLVVSSSADSQLRALVQTGLVAAELAPEPVPTVTAVSVQGSGAVQARNFAFGAAILLYVALVLTGTWVATGIVEEKSNRIAEVVLSSVRPRELLLGKLLGIGLVALGQVAAAAATAVLAALATGSSHLPNGLVGAAASLVGWFAIGYALSACAFAAAASLVSRQEDLPAVTTPLNAVTGAAFFAAMSAAQHPGGSLTRVLSVLPPFSALLMPVRMIGGEVSGWEVAGAVALALAALGGALMLATAIYSGAVLRSGSPISFRSAGRSVMRP